MYWSEKEKSYIQPKEVYRACVDRSCPYCKLIFIKRPGTPLGKGTAVCGLGMHEQNCDDIKKTDFGSKNISINMVQHGENNTQIEHVNTLIIE